MGEAIVITSGKGGVGKTTTSANIGTALALQGKKVCLVDTDIGLRNLDVVMGLENRIIYDLVDVVEGRCKIHQALVKDKRFEDLLYLLPAAQTVDKSAIKPEQMHNPCFCLYELYPRKINYGEVIRGHYVLRIPLPALIDAEDYFPADANYNYGCLLYPCFFLRAHDILAFPSNASGGIRVAHFISYYLQQETGENVPIGAYIHHAGSLHICDYAIPKQTLNSILERLKRNEGLKEE